MDFRAEPRALLTKDQNAVLWQAISFQGNGVREDIDPQDRQRSFLRPSNKFLHRRMMTHVLVTIRNHCTASVPPAASNDMDFLGQEGIGAAHHGADVHVVLPVLNGDM